MVGAGLPPPSSLKRLEPAPFDELREGLNEIGPAPATHHLTAQDIDGFLRGVRTLIRTSCRYGVIYVHEADDLRDEWDLVSGIEARRTTDLQ